MNTRGTILILLMLLSVTAYSQEKSTYWGGGCDTTDLRAFDNMHAQTLLRLYADYEKYCEGFDTVRVKAGMRETADTTAGGWQVFEYIYENKPEPRYVTFKGFIDFLRRRVK